MQDGKKFSQLQRNNSNSCAAFKYTRRGKKSWQHKSSQRHRERQMRNIKLLYESQKFHIITKLHQEKGRKRFSGRQF